MSRSFEQATLADAVGRLRPGMKVLLPAGCGDPSALLAEILRQADRLAPLTPMGGPRGDGHPLGPAADTGEIRFATAPMSPPPAGAAAPGRLGFAPPRH